jgi:hypothetical protein
LSFKALDFQLAARTSDVFAIEAEQVIEWHMKKNKQKVAVMGTINPEQLSR